jgi:hypothetical protein
MCMCYKWLAQEFVWYHTKWQMQIGNSRHQKQGKDTKMSGTQSQGKVAECGKIHKTAWKVRTQTQVWYLWEDRGIVTALS